MKSILAAKLWKDRLLCLALAQLLLLSVMVLHENLGNSYINDEASRLGAGYTYLTERSMRLVLVDPPLGKDLSALPLLFLGLKAPRTLASLPAGHLADGNGFIYGPEFMTKQDVPMMRILFWGRLPTLLFSLALGFLTFWWGRELFGGLAGNLALLFYGFSPTILSHSGFVTLDIFAGFAATWAIYSYLAHLRRPTRSTLILATSAFVFALNIKFNIWPIIPLFVAATFLWGVLGEGIKLRQWRDLGLMMLVAAASLLLIYEFHLSGYPQAEWLAEVQAVIGETKYAAWAPAAVRLAQYPILNALVLMAMGFGYKVIYSVGYSYLDGLGFYGTSLKFYPTAILLKEPLAVSIFLGLALYAAASRAATGWRATVTFNSGVVAEALKRHFTVFVMLAWCLGYLYIAIFNYKSFDGLRYLIPVTPMIYILIAGGVTYLVRTQVPLRRVTAGACALLAVWEVVSVAKNHPYHLAYISELGGGPDKGGSRFALSSYELASEAKRLADWVSERGIEHIKVASSYNFFTVDAPQADVLGWWYYPSYQYFLGSRFEQWDSTKPTTGWIAIPGTLYNWGTALPRRENGWGSDTFRWLEGKEPVARIGHAVLVFHVENAPEAPTALGRSRSEAFQYAIQRAPSAALYFGLGWRQYLSQDKESAVKSYREAIRLDPRYAAAYNNLGSLLNEQNKFREAGDILRQGVQLDPASELMRNNLAVAERGLAAAPKP